MDKLERLITEFWEWTGLFPQKWETTDLSDLSLDPTDFPKIGEICLSCIMQINTPMDPHEANLFLTGLAIDSEDEDILASCQENADESFLNLLASYGVSHPQSGARWQIAELMRRGFPDRNRYLRILLFDPNEYVRRRANNVALDINFMQ